MHCSCGSTVKESACNAGDLGSIPGLGRSPGERKGCPLQHSGLENAMDYIVLGVTKSQTGLSNFHFTSSAKDSTPHNHSRTDLMASITSPQKDLLKSQQKVRETGES